MSHDCPGCLEPSSPDGNRYCDPCWRAYIVDPSFNVDDIGRAKIKTNICMVVASRLVQKRDLLSS